MTDIDIVAELRRLWEKAPQGKWEYSGPFDDGDEAGWIETRDENGDVWPVVGIGIDRPEVIDLIVAMHEALPALLDAVDALRWYADTGNYHDPTDVPDHLYRDSGDVLLIRGGGGQRARAALAALKRSDEG